MAENTFDLFDWLNTGTIATRDVDIYIDHEAYGKLQALVADLDEHGDVSLGGGAQRAQLRAQIDQLREQLEASKMVWRVRAISDAEAKESLEAVPAPRLPVKPDGLLNKQAQAKWQAEAAVFAKESAKADAARRLWVIALATEQIETTLGVQDSITVADLEKILNRPHGSGWLARIHQAIEEATTQEVTPDFPQSPDSFTNIPV